MLILQYSCRIYIDLQVRIFIFWEYNGGGYTWWLHELYVYLISRNITSQYIIIYFTYLLIVIVMKSHDIIPICLNLYTYYFFILQKNKTF